MKNYLLSFFLFCLLNTSLLFASNNKTGPSQSIKNSNVYKVVITYTATLSDSESTTFTFSGRIVQVVIDVTGTDADGTVAIADPARTLKTYAAGTLTADRDYVLSCSDESANGYGGPYVDGDCTVTVANAADLTALVITLYLTK